MTFARAIKRRARAAAPPVLFLGLAAYFAWSSAQGEHGLNLRAERERRLEVALAAQLRVENEFSAWQRRIGSLRSSRLDPDALDERARAMLNLSDPADIIVPLKPADRVF